MSTIRDGLLNPAAMSESEFTVALRYTLVDKDRNITELGKRILAKDHTAMDEIRKIQDKLYPQLWPAWVVDPPYYYPKRVFGPGYKF